jgi:hypothetical protein
LGAPGIEHVADQQADRRERQRADDERGEQLRPRDGRQLDVVDDQARDEDGAMAGIVTTNETMSLPATYAAAGSGVTRSWRVQPDARSSAITTAPPIAAMIAAYVAIETMK